MSNYSNGYSNGRWDAQTWSLRLGTAFGIRIRVHLLLVIMAVVFLAQSTGLGTDYALMTIIAEVFLFGSVLAHEFGHCFACRAVGGTADDILLWPLGGLAACAPPHRPKESLITTLGGPAVNLAVMVLLTPVIYFQGAMSTALWNPFGFGVVGSLVDPVFYTTVLFKINYGLLLFNMLLPIFPFDCGRVIQELMWFRIGYVKATLIATNIGMGGAILMAAVSLYCQNLMLASIAVFGFIQSLQTQRELEANGHLFENEFGYDFSQGYTSLERSLPKTQRKESSPTIANRFRAWARRRREKMEAVLETELDRILEKIHQHGIGSLTRTEKKTLNQASKKRRRPL